MGRSKGVEAMERIGAATIVAAGLLVAAGLAGGGFLVGKGITGFKSDVRTVTVKGLVEREVRADEATWRLSFRRAGNALPELYAAIQADRAAVVAFLHARGFTDAELEIQPTRAADKLAQDYTEGREAKLRYVLSTGVVVRTRNVDAVHAALGATDALVKAGVLVDTGENGIANPRYAVSRFNELRPRLLAEATRNARATATQFASDSGAVVGRIVSANQGNIQIFGTDGHDESAPYAPTSTPGKKIRVVSTFEFALR